MKTAIPMLDSPIKWVGGKSKLRSQVIDYLPSDAECYAEVFAGAAWVLFGKIPHPVEVINDANSDLVNLYRVLKWRKAELLEEVHQYIYSREMFYELRKDSDAKCEVERAARTYLLIQMAFGADISEAGSASFGYRSKKMGDLFLNQSIERFEKAKERLREVFIENGDFEKLISRYDQPRTIFFCDPPYFEQSGYESAFGIEDHIRLSTVLHSIEGRFLMTVNDHPEIRMMYRDCRILEGVEARTISRSTEGREAAPILFIANYDFGKLLVTKQQASLFENL